VQDAEDTQYYFQSLHFYSVRVVLLEIYLNAPNRIHKVNF